MQVFRTNRTPVVCGVWRWWFPRVFVVLSTNLPLLQSIILFALDKYSGGGNPVHPREIPVWQKEITCFFQAKNGELPLPSANDEDEDDAVVEIPLQEMMQAGSSKM